MQHLRIPGLILGVVQNDKVVLIKGYGVKRLGTREVPDENTVFAIGSVSKAITAVGAMMLVDKGKANLDAPISTYLHDLPRAWEKITVRQYMTHTSGIPDFPKSRTFQDAVRRVANRPLQFPPGTQQKYTNANFAVIGQMIQAVTGQSYESYMHDALFAPLGMNSTGSYKQFLRGNRATGYQGHGSNRHQAEPTVAEYGIPSGGLVSTMSDLLKLNAALLQQKLMSPTTYKEMYTRTIPPGAHDPWHFAPGWQARMAGQDEVIAKNGMVAGFGCQWQFVPERQLAVIMIWNLSAKDDDLWASTAQILWRAFGVITQQREAQTLRTEPRE